MQVIKQKILTLELVEDECDIFITLLKKVKTESNKVGFKKMLEPEEIELLDLLVEQCKK